MGEHRHGRLVRRAERRTRAYGVDAGLLGREHERVEVALESRERPVDGQRAGHVGGVERGRLGAHVEQHQLAGGDRAGVVDPVQRRGVAPAAHDRVVADVVAHRAGPAEEGALDPALAVLQHAVPLAHRVLEAERGDVAGALQLAQLPLVLDETQLGEDAGEVAVAAGVPGDEGVDASIDPAQHAGLGRAAQTALELVEVAGLDAERVRDLLQGGAAPCPELAVLPVPEELVGLARAARPGVEHGLAALDHQHGVAGLVAAEVGVRGLGAEAEVGVVRAHLEAARRDRPAARGGTPRRAAPTGLGPGRDRVCREVELALAPAGAHEGGVGLGHGRVVALRHRLVTLGWRRSRGCPWRQLTRPLYVRGSRYATRMQRRRSAAFTIVVTLVMFVGAIGMGIVLLLSGAPGALVVGLVLAAFPVGPLIACYMWLDRYEPEPRSLLVLGLGWGAFVATSIALVLQVFDSVIFQQHRRVHGGRRRAGHRGGGQGAVHPAAAVLPPQRARRGARRPGVRRDGRHRLRVHREHPLPDPGLHGRGTTRPGA